MRWIDVIAFRAIMRTTFSSLASSTRIGSRRDAWDFTIRTVAGKEPAQRKILVLEFGVYKGTSIRYFASGLPNPDCRFFGFDSFEGLPVEWSNKPAGTFSREGSPPEMDDPRISLVKGWFQDTLPQFAVSADGYDAVLVHMDADVYSSTLFVLSQLWSRLDQFYVLFDEFMNDETRALHDCSQAYPARIEFIAHDNPVNPQRVLCKFSKARIAA
jgi:hypothetical protein